MNQRIKILQLSSTLVLGGAEQLLLGLARSIDRSRFELHMCSLSVFRGNALQPDFEQLGLPLKVIGARRFYDPLAAAAIARYVRAHTIDIIHTHLSNADVVGRLVGRALGCPVVSTMQNEPRDYNRARLDHRWLERATARHLATNLIAVSERIRAMFVQEWRIPAERISMIPNAVAMAPFLAIPAQSPQRPAGEGPLITTIGRLNPQKGQHHLLDAARLVLARRPDTRFMVVGEGRLDQALKAHARSLGIADRVDFAGLRRDIPAVLAQTDIFTLPSLWEGLPLTAIEAMAAARPVVLTDVGGNRELVTSGAAGVIVPPGDAPALAQALLALLDDPQRRATMGRVARTHVWPAYSIEAIAAQHEALYESIWRARCASARLARLATKS